MIGYPDDLVLVPLLIALAVKRIPAQVLAECREKAKGQREQKKLRYAIPTILVYVVVIILIAWRLFI